MPGRNAGLYAAPNLERQGTAALDDDLEMGVADPSLLLDPSLKLGEDARFYGTQVGDDDDNNNKYANWDYAAPDAGMYAADLHQNNPKIVTGSLNTKSARLNKNKNDDDDQKKNRRKKSRARSSGDGGYGQLYGGGGGGGYGGDDHIFDGQQVDYSQPTYTKKQWDQWEKKQNRQDRTIEKQNRTNYSKRSPAARTLSDENERRRSLQQRNSIIERMESRRSSTP